MMPPEKGTCVSNASRIIRSQVALPLSANEAQNTILCCAKRRRLNRWLNLEPTKQKPRRRALSNSRPLRRLKLAPIWWVMVLWLYTPSTAPSSLDKLSPSRSSLMEAPTPPTSPKSAHQRWSSASCETWILMFLLLEGYNGLTPHLYTRYHWEPRRERPPQCWHMAWRKLQAPVLSEWDSSTRTISWLWRASTSSPLCSGRPHDRHRLFWAAPKEGGGQSGR